MLPSPDRHRVYKSMSRPLTLCGIERRLFFLSLLLGAATFNLFYRLLAAVLLFAVVYGFARASAGADPQMLAITMRSARSRAQYDAARAEFGAHKR